MKKSIKKNYLFNLLYQILLLLTPMITAPYVSRVLGPDGIGQVSYTESIATYFVLFATMGITTYGQREISYVQDDRSMRSVIFWNTKVLEFIISVLVLLFYFIFIFCGNGFNDYLLFIFSLNILSVFVDVTWLFQGMEEFGKIVSRNVVFKVLSVIYIFLVVKDENDICFYAFGLCFFTFISNASLWVSVPKVIDLVSINHINPFKDFRAVVSLFIPTIAISVYTVLDKTMIGIITKNALENGYYEQALKISKMILTVVTALSSVTIPRVGFYFKKNDFNKLESLMYRAYRFVWFLCIPLSFGLIMISSNFVPWFYGDEYYEVINLLRVLAFLILAIGINNVTGMQYLVPTKRQGLFTVTVLIGAIVNFVLNCILIPRFHALGAAIASVVAESVIAIVQLIFVKDEINPIKILSASIKYFISGFLMAVVLYFIGINLLPSLTNTLILTLIGAFVYFLLLFILKDVFFLSNIGSVKKVVDGIIFK